MRTAASYPAALRECRVGGAMPFLDAATGVLRPPPAARSRLPARSVEAADSIPLWQQITLLDRRRP